MGLDERLARLRAEMIRLRLVTPRQANGLPWCFSLPEAAAFLGCTEADVSRLIELGAIHSVYVGERMISATQVLVLKRRLEMGWDLRRALRVR